MVYESVNKTEYQGRGTPHWHIAAWVLCFGPLQFLCGNTGKGILSAFVMFLKSVFHCEIDVQVGNGRLNYINGYVSKDHDAVDVGLGEYVQSSSTAPWLATYRLISKSTPCIPEVAIRMASLSEFDRTYSHVLLYPPQPANCVSLEERKVNFSTRMYGIYAEEMRLLTAAGQPIPESFLVWHRTREWDQLKQTCVYRAGGRDRFGKTLVVACRYWYELSDGFWGQFVITQIPHANVSDILPKKKCLDCMQNFFGMLEYLQSWVWAGDGIIKAAGCTFRVSALPLVCGIDGELLTLGDCIVGQHVFKDDSACFEYLMLIAKRDLQYRGFRDDRVNSFEYKHEANFLLHQRVLAAKDELEFELYRQSWDVINRPKYQDRKWSPQQQDVLDNVESATSYDDEEAKSKSKRFLYVKGCPGSGKSAVLIEAAIRAARKGLTVLIVCPTGALVTSIKLLLPNFDGVELIHVDTIHGILKYKRGKDANVSWVPPSAFRKYDVVFCDEASQYDDLEWTRLFKTLKEQPHSPYCVLVADFQQLQPVSGGGLCKKFCERMPCIELQTVYRTSCPEHLLFQNRIREHQVEKECIRDYFGDRHWTQYTLGECVAYGLMLAKDKGTVFTWLTATNRGSTTVCEAALDHLGISAEELDGGYPCDPTSKSSLKILARPGLVLRLTRNLDKSRGFVNGALAVVCESLGGNAFIVCRLIGTGNLVLVHPMEENGERFLPCCYGYATTIRRAQGASLDMGCIYFDQHRHHAGRGYGYVAVSRFKSKAACFLYGKLRRTDFLPVGEERDGEVLDRGIQSQTSDEDDIGIEHAFNGGNGDDIFDYERQYEVYTPEFQDDFAADYVAPEVSLV